MMDHIASAIQEDEAPPDPYDGKIRPIKARVYVRRRKPVMMSTGGIHLFVVEQEKQYLPFLADVIAVGPDAPCEVGDVLLVNAFAGSGGINGSYAVRDGWHMFLDTGPGTGDVLAYAPGDTNLQVV